MSYLTYFLYLRVEKIWAKRYLPSYLGPSVASLISLFILCVVNLITVFAVGLLFIRNSWCLITNVTTIESWEIERHESLVRKAKTNGGFLDAPRGARIRITKQEFPYDIGVWQNINQGMGGSFLSWLWPLSATPDNASGLSFAVNEFEDASLSWPPPDPDRMATFEPIRGDSQDFPPDDGTYVQAFHDRQQEDLRRRRHAPQQPFEEARKAPIGEDLLQESDRSNRYHHLVSRSGWRDSDGDGLEDFGVDEQVEFYDEDDIPLAELLRKRHAH